MGEVIRVDPETYERIDQLARGKGLSKAKAISRIVDENEKSKSKTEHQDIITKEDVSNIIEKELDKRLSPIVQSEIKSIPYDEIHLIKSHLANDIPHQLTNIQSRVESNSRQIQKLSGANQTQEPPPTQPFQQEPTTPQPIQTPSAQGSTKNEEGGSLGGWIIFGLILWGLLSRQKNSETQADQQNLPERNPRQPSTSSYRISNRQGYIPYFRHSC